MRKCVLQAKAEGEHPSNFKTSLEVLQVLGKVLELHLSPFRLACLPSAMKKCMGKKAKSFLLVLEALPQNHRITEGRDLCGSSSPSPLPKQGHLEQAAQDLVQAGFKYLQRRRLHNLSGQVRMHMHSPCTPALGKTLVEPLTHLTPASPPVSGFEDRHCSSPSACWPRPPLAPAAALRPPPSGTQSFQFTHTQHRERDATGR